MQQREIAALISLLDDPDREVSTHVRSKLLAHTNEVLPFLKNYFDPSLTPLHYQHIQELIADMQFSTIKAATLQIVQEGTDYMAFLTQMAMLINGSTEPDSIQKKYQRIRQTIWLEMGNNQTFLEQLHIFNKVFYEVLKFSGDATAGNLSEFNVDMVLENRKGAIITIGMLYLSLANEMGLKTEGVCLKKYFILCTSKAAIYGIADDSKDLSNFFYINPINSGILFAKNEIDLYLEKSGFEKSLSYYYPATFRQICSEYLSYLRDYLENTFQNDLLEKVIALKQAVSND